MKSGVRLQFKNSGYQVLLVLIRDWRIFAPVSDCIVLTQPPTAIRYLPLHGHQLSSEADTWLTLLVHLSMITVLSILY